MKEKLVAVARILSNQHLHDRAATRRRLRPVVPEERITTDLLPIQERRQDQVGTFDVQAVQGVVSADYKKTGDVLTEYDEQQARLRCQLEQQRHDIEQAGGVAQEGDDEGAVA